jgi:Uma2 family endonuclease
MTALAEKKYTFEEYLELEKNSGIRHEFVDGVVRAMAGEKRVHKRIAANVYRTLFDPAEARACEVMLEAKVRTLGTRYRYPDVTVSCAPGDDEYFLENPCFIAEVLSESTANTDATEKLEEYLKLPSLQRYVLVEQTVKRVIAYRRSEQGWMVDVLEDSGEIDIPCLETTLTLAQIYAGLEFA